MRDRLAARWLGRLVAEVGEALRQGRSVVVQVPEFGTSWLRREIEREAKHVADDRRWTRVRLRADQGGCTCGSVAALIGADWEGDGSTVEALIENDNFRRVVVWVDGVDATTGPAFYGFLDRFQVLVQGVVAEDRACLVACVPGGVAGAPSGSPRLAVMRWKDRVQRVDTILAAGAGEPRADEVPLLRAVRQAVAAEVAQWDLAFAEDLSCRSLEQLLEPHPLVEDWKRRQGWSDAAVESPSWDNGLVDTLDGIRQLHAVALLGRPGQLDWRVWSGLVAVLFPVLEEIRRGMIDRYRDLLKVPWLPGPGLPTVEDLPDLEISHIRSQLREFGGVLAPELIEGLRVARDIRNNLAHFRPVPAPSVRSPALAGLLVHIRDDCARLPARRAGEDRAPTHSAPGTVASGARNG